MGKTEAKELTRGFKFAFIESVLKPVEPILVMVSAAVFVGGPWGVFKFYETLVFMLFRFATLSFDRALVWYFSQSDSEGFSKQYFKILNLVLLISLIISALFIMTYGGWIPGVDWLIGSTSDFKISLTLFIVFMAALPLMVITTINTHVLAATGDYKTGVVIRTIITPILTYGSALLFYFSVEKSSILPWTLLLGNATVAVYSLIKVYLQGHVQLKFWSFSLILQRNLMGFVSPLMVETIFSAISSRVDIFLLAGIGGVKAVEVYHVISMIGKSIVGLRQSFERAMLASFSRTKNPSVLDYNYSIRTVMAMLVPVMGVLICWGQYLLNTMGAQYGEGYIALVILLVLLFITVIFDFAGIFAIALGRTWIAPIVQVVNMILVVGLNLLLIPMLDYTGAVLSNGFALLISGSLWYWVAKKGHTGLIQLKPLLWVILPLIGYGICALMDSLILRSIVFVGVASFNYYWFKKTKQA